MHVLVTGGTGFIGRLLCARLHEAGHAVSVLTRDPARAQVPGARLVVALEQAEGVDAVVNLAGASLFDRRWTDAYKQVLRASRIDGTRRLVAWMARQPAPPRVLVSGSAIGWYGPRDDAPLDETVAPGEDFAAWLCRDWEAEAMRATALGVRTCLLRTGIVLDRGGGALEKMLPPFRFGLGGPMGDGRQWMSWIHREDLVRLAIWLIGQPGAQGAFNGTAPGPVANGVFARTLGTVLRRPARLRVPGFALRLALGEMAGLLLSGQRVLPTRALDAGFAFLHPGLEGALRASLDAPAGAGGR
ncbi:TIGR01777 family oxidoreductase [Pseudomonas sp. Hp2]|uniref:TIGR01777 family oxidoreductase n=1 Tax=Pseudomonas sp. Hp2 TaxID=701189 RepID=UPI00112C666D|nr:TIGR01777 family oxidoreductase [Pseudomonas sp. Hp2]